MNECLANWANIATMVIAVGAFVAALIAWWNLNILRKQSRNNTFLELTSAIADSEARKDRAILHKIYIEASKKGILPDVDGDKYPKRIADFFIARGGGPHLWKDEYDINDPELNKILRDVQHVLKLGDEEVFTRFKEAFENTISLFDRMGFFLLKGDASLREEAPVWVWDITNNMWEYLGDYIENRQAMKERRDKNHAKYFKDLAIIAKEKIEKG